MATGRVEYIGDRHLVELTRGPADSGKRIEEWVPAALLEELPKAEPPTEAVEAERPGK